MSWKRESARHAMAARGIKSLNAKGISSFESACSYCGYEWVKGGEVCPGCGFVDSEYCDHDEGYAKEQCIKCGSSAEDIMRPPNVRKDDKIQYFEWRSGKTIEAIANSSVYWDESTNSYEVWLHYNDRSEDVHYAYWNEDTKRWESGEM